MKPLVSIIVPIYNMENFLEKSVSSISLQTYSNIEIILINDGSTDNSQKVCEILSKTDKRIKVIQKINEGVSIARNTGIQYSNGFYIMFVDPDDWLSKDIVKKLLDTATTAQSDIASCGALIEFEHNSIENTFYRRGTGLIEKNRAIAQLYSNDHYKDADKYMDIGVPWGKLYKASLIKDNSLNFVPELRRNQDNIFNLYAFHHANRIAYIDEPLYHYNYEHYKSGSRKVMNDAVELYTRYAKEIISFYNKNYSDDKLFSFLLKKRLSGLLINILTNKLCNPNSQILFYERINRIEQICESSEFSIIFNEGKIPSISKRATVILALLKNRNYKLVYSVYFIGFKLKL